MEIKPDFAYTVVDATKNLLTELDRPHYYANAQEVLEDLQNQGLHTGPDLLTRLCGGIYTIDVVSHLIASEHPVTRTWDDLSCRVALQMAASAEVGSFKSIFAIHEKNLQDPEVYIDIPQEELNYLRKQVDIREKFKSKLWERPAPIRSNENR